MSVNLHLDEKRLQFRDFWDSFLLFDGLMRQTGNSWVMLDFLNRSTACRTVSVYGDAFNLVCTGSQQQRWEVWHRCACLQLTSSLTNSSLTIRKWQEVFGNKTLSRMKEKGKRHRAEIGMCSRWNSRCNEPVCWVSSSVLPSGMWGRGQKGSDPWSRDATLQGQAEGN